MNALIERCRLAGIRLQVEGADLQCDAPKGAMTPELIAELTAHKAELLTALTHPDPLPPLSPAQEARRQKLLAILARDGIRHAVHVEDPNTDPVVMALATPAATCELRIPKDRYDPFEVLAIVKEWERESLPQARTGDAEPGPLLWWRVSITEPGGRTVEVDTPSGMSLAEWGTYSERHYAPGSVVTPLAELPGPQTPVPLDEVLAAAVESLEGITVAEFRVLLSPEDVADIEAGDIPVETLKAYAASFAEGIRSGRVALPERTS